MWGATLGGLRLKPMTEVLTVNNISHRYGDKLALNEVSFHISPGQRLVLLGPNGAGKSTLLGLLTRLLKIQQGRIAVNGCDIHTAREKALRGVGVVFQQSTLDLDLTVEQNLQYHGALHGLTKQTTAQAITRELTRLALPETLKTRVRKLNGGHRRRVEIARALLHQPNLLLLDEPTVGLDLASRAALNNDIKSLSKNHQSAVLWTTHLMEEVSPEDQLLVINRGKTLAQGPCSQLLRENNCETATELFNQLTGAPA